MEYRSSQRRFRRWWILAGSGRRDDGPRVRLAPAGAERLQRRQLRGARSRAVAGSSGARRSSPTTRSRTWAERSTSSKAARRKSRRGLPMAWPSPIAVWTGTSRTQIHRSRRQRSGEAERRSGQRAGTRRCCTNRTARSCSMRRSGPTCARRSTGRRCRRTRCDGDGHPSAVQWQGRFARARGAQAGQPGRCARRKS